MASIFISYGDDRFKVSLDRIIRQARHSGLFDKVVKYTPKDLPSYVRSSPLFSQSKGGGCWCWKPYVISNALANCNEGDVVYYADAGCTIISDSPEWDKFKQLLKDYSSIYFQYRKDYSYPGWERYCKEEDSDKTVIKHWMKPSLVEYFSHFHDPDMLEFDSLWAGFIIFKKTRNTSVILDQWLKITFFHPELVVSPLGAELQSLPYTYYGHRYDQSILSPLVCHYMDMDNALVLPETSESQLGSPAVLASRWRQAAFNPISYLKYRLFEKLHK